MRVAICDDHRTFGEALATLLNGRGHEVVGHTISPQDAELARFGADVILVDLSFPGVEGCEAVATVRKAAPSVPIVVLTANPDWNLLEEALEKGADGVVLKTEGIDELESVLLKVASKHAPGGLGGQSARVRSRLVQAQAKRHRQRGPRLDLTKRELEVLEGLAAGLATAELAQSMGVQIATVRTHVQHLLAKFGAHSRVEMVASAIRMGLVAPQIAGRGSAVRKSS
jgi:two-component system, NarL family, nitrate/nitrite response regulator NarL